MPAHLRHLTDVGRNKAVGLLSMPEFLALGANVGRMRNSFNQRARPESYLFIEMKEGDMFWDTPLKAGDGNVAIACLPMLQKLIDAKKESVEAMGWPTDAAEFFVKSLETSLISTDHPARKEVMSVILEAYNHPYTPDKWRKKRFGLF